MSKLTNYNGCFCESEYEYAFIQLLENEGWQYLSGDKLPRDNEREVLHIDDLKKFLSDSYSDLGKNDINNIANKIKFFNADNDFSTLHCIYDWLSSFIVHDLENGSKKNIQLINYDNPEKNIFRVVNQLVIEYTNNGVISNRRPDILLYINGIPVCNIELKNPAKKNATIEDAYYQITTRYWRDIPHLLHYCPLACISDGVKTRLGTVKTPYQHFYAWRRINNEDKVSTTPFEETKAMIKGVYSPSRFLEIFRDYIIFQDKDFDYEEKEIVCRYPQFFATRLLKQSIIKCVKTKSNKGGTYFGAMGCGKTYTMAFLARQLALRCTDVPEIGSPTIIVIVDRDELQNQNGYTFTKSKDFLNLGKVEIIKTRKKLREELKLRDSGGFYICTIQKFCDREDDKIGLINSRSNIICFSDEAHRTQIEHSKKIKFAKDINETIKEMITKPYATVLREAFPHATFVGFTGTPIVETYQTFGDEIDRYTIDQAVADEITLNIKYNPRIAKVLMDEKKIKLIENYYKMCFDDGATREDIETSKKAMSSIEVILGDKDRLEKLAIDIHDHYTKSCAEDPKRVQKAMVVCSSREICYKLLKIFEKKYPEWFKLKKSVDDSKLTKEELSKLKPMPFMAMVASVGKDDEPEMYDYLGGAANDNRTKELDIAYKQEKSNFSIVLVVDMWLAGFDVPPLTYLYNDKPIQKHNLIQAITRVNRKYPGKEFGWIIDYIGIRNNMREALKMYGGNQSIALTKNDVEQALKTFNDQLKIIKDVFIDYDLDAFISKDCEPVKRYELLCKAAEFVFYSTKELNIDNPKTGKVSKATFKEYFLKNVTRLKAAYEICGPSGELNEKDSALAQYFMAISQFVRKMSGTSELDTESMNRTVSNMLEEALKYSKVESVLGIGETEEIFSPKFYNKLADIKMPATKLEILIKMLKKNIATFKKTNQIEGQKFQELLEKTIEQYHERRKVLPAEEAGETQEQTTDGIIKEATEQALKLLQDLNESKNSFRKLGLTFAEKAFYDILMHSKEVHNFEYGVDKKENGIVVNNKCKELAKKIKEIIDTKSSYADWLNNQNIRNELKLDIKICLVKNGYPPTYSPEVFSKVMEQVENLEKNLDYDLD